MLTTRTVLLRVKCFARRHIQSNENNLRSNIFKTIKQCHMKITPCSFSFRMKTYHRNKFTAKDMSADLLVLAYSEHVGPKMSLTLKGYFLWYNQILY